LVAAPITFHWELSFRGVEAFTGFDYLDYRDHHEGFLIAGLRGWF
jgi:hypothetical protein